MHLTNKLRSFLIDESYYIDIYKGHIHVFHYIDILVLQSDMIRLQMDGFQLAFQGKDFRVKRLEHQEILILGELQSLHMDV